MIGINIAILSHAIYLYMNSQFVTTMNVITILNEVTEAYLIYEVEVEVGSTDGVGGGRVDVVYSIVMRNLGRSYIRLFKYIDNS